ncbi:MAG: DsbA family protein [Parcubacteria group bacterium]|nr:DsbA family protein [Parcubacteria group bacterium]
MQYIKKPWYKTWRGAVILFFSATILFVLTIGVFYFIGTVKNGKTELSQAAAKLSGPIFQAAAGQHYWLGNDQAKITIVEFGDFACPVCEKAFPTIREISLKYKNDIKFIWRDYPVVQDYSALLALSARCAGEQGLFWPMHDKLFQNQGVSAAEQLTALANQAGADTVRFKDCLSQQKYLPQIQKDLSDGQTFGNIGTPTYFINGHRIPGDIPYDVFVKIIEELKK